MQGTISSHFVGLSGGLLMSVIAFSIVFIIIAGLMIMMMLLKAFVGGINRQEAGKPAPAPAAKAPAAAAPAAATAVTQTTPDAGGAEDEIAAIMAAIACVLGGGARVTSIVTADGEVIFNDPYHARSMSLRSSSAWKMAGIMSNSGGIAD